MRNGQRFAYVSDAAFRSAVAPSGAGLKALAEQHGTDVNHLAVRAAFTAEVAKAEGEGAERSVDIVISTESPDRDRDVITVDGWDLRSYRRNSVVLFAHDYYSLPVARGENVRAEDGKLKATAKFVPADIYPFAETVYRMLSGGWMSAASVGFRPKKWEYNEERRGVDFHEQELLEFSIVPVPANAECLVEARAAGVDVEPLKAWAEQTLEWLGHPASASAVAPIDIHALSARLAKDLRAIRAAEECPKAGQCGLLATDTGVCPAAGDCPMGRGQAASANGVVKVGVLTLGAVAVFKAALAKRGRVLSGANERRLRDAASAAEAASAKIAEVVAQVEQAPEADSVEEETEREAAKKAPGSDVIVLDGELLDLDAIPYADERDALSDLTAEDVMAALRESVSAEAATGVRRAINAATGRVD